MQNQNQKKQLGFWFYLTVIIITLWVILFNANSGYVIKQFSETFSGFGAELPTLTHWIINHIPFVWIGMVYAAIVQLCLLLLIIITRSTLSIKLFLIVFMFNILLEITIITAMYLPIFHLGHVIG